MFYGKIFSTKSGTSKKGNQFYSLQIIAEPCDSNNENDEVLLPNEFCTEEAFRMAQVFSKEDRVRVEVGVLSKSFKTITGVYAAPKKEKAVIDDGI